MFRASNVTVANNTAIGNGTDTCISAYYLGDLSQAGGAHDVWINNIAQSVQTVANPFCAYCGNRNTPLVAGGAAGIADLDETYADNVTYGGYGVQLFTNDLAYFSCSSNKCNTNPMITNPATGNFSLMQGSPASDYGVLVNYVAAQTPYVGACGSALESCPLTPVSLIGATRRRATAPCPDLLKPWPHFLR